MTATNMLVRSVAVPPEATRAISHRVRRRARAGAGAPP